MSDEKKDALTVGETNKGEEITAKQKELIDLLRKYEKSLSNKPINRDIVRNITS